MGYHTRQLPVTEAMNSVLPRLLFYLDVNKQYQVEVVDAIMTFFQSIRYSADLLLSQRVASLLIIIT
jgi:hypothetical protein